MTIGAVGHEFGRRHVLARRHFVVRRLVRPFEKTRPVDDAEILESIENRPRPPFSLSGTISYVAFSRSFYRFVAGELLLALFLRSRRDWSHLYPPQFDVDGGVERGPGVPVAAQVNQLASRVRHEVPTTDDGAQGNAVGTRLNLLV